MNFCGVICEFNPFHNGHKYLFDQAKKLSNCEILCLMSGDFVQRGEPAIQDKYTRAENAINAGANCVLELPTIYASSNAENFATGAIKILKKLNVKALAFGIENTNIYLLWKIARLKYENSNDFVNSFKNEINNGVNYNTALKRAITKSIGDDKVFEILNKPNNILAVEYLTAILKLDAKFEIYAIERCDNGYNSNNSKDAFLSASTIRELIYNGKNYKLFVPKNTITTNYFDSDAKLKFEALVCYKLRSINQNELKKHYDYSEGIEFRVKEMSNKFGNIDEIEENIVTPRYRQARVKKLLLYPLLNITKDAETLSKKTKPAIKVLAIKKDNKYLLSNFNKNKISLIVSNQDYLNLSKNQKRLFDIDINASNVYNLCLNKPYNNDIKIGTKFI